MALSWPAHCNQCRTCGCNAGPRNSHGNRRCPGPRHRARAAPPRRRRCACGRWCRPPSRRSREKGEAAYPLRGMYRIQVALSQYPALNGLLMRSAMGDTSTSLSVGIFSAGSPLISMPSTAWVSLASFARSAWLVDAERATEKNRNTGRGSCDRPSSRQPHGRCRAAARALPCRICPWLESAPAPR